VNGCEGRNRTSGRVVNSHPNVPAHKPRKKRNVLPRTSPVRSHPCGIDLTFSLYSRRGTPHRSPGRWSPQLYSGVDHGTAASPVRAMHAFQVLLGCQ